MPRRAQRRGRPRRARGARLFNLLAVACLGLSVVSVGWVVGVTVNPYGGFNPFPPRVQALEPLEPIVLVTMTPTASATAPATVAATVTPNSAPADASTPAPSFPTATAEVARPRETSAAPTLAITRWLTPTSTASPTPRPLPTRAAFTYTAVITLQVHPVQLCDWMGVAGSVIDLQGKPALGAYVRVWGTGNVDQVVAAGANPMYGASGWEVRLARAQIVGSWSLQLVSSPDAKSPLSDVYLVAMPGDCKKNLALVRLDQNH